ncbi:glycosyltransferase [Paenibacillus xylanexedens]|uniref:glycosyltransferase family 2 protein n=1 Tax=Paenibacillus xylanexedens TaxID=528191 RepID=UPI001F1AC5B3|nr:glycosyltransferase family 2 protein [Paenibacillus xylanexedens]MCF7757111.1 glycosyltransferase [Paenibacillus xylanexedens]
MTKSVSLCMIVKNEERYIERCLESVKQVVNEIIIVDTGSNDATIDIANKYTTNIYSFDWVNDFSAARNFAIKHAKSDYILVMDADEYLEEDVDLQKDLIKDYDYYVFNIKNHMKFNRSFTHTAVRMFRNHADLKYENRLHEHLNLLENNDKYIGDISAFMIEHVGYMDEEILEEKKYKRNLPLMKLEVQEHPTPYNLFNMGKTYFGMNEFKKAVPYFQKSYSLGKDKVYLPELLTKLAFALNETGQINDALSILKDATALYPLETEMKYIQGIIYLNTGYYKDAEECFLHCLESGDQGTLITEGSGSYMAHLQLSYIYEKSNQLDKSYSARINAMEIKGDSAHVLQNYLQFSLKINQPLDDIEKIVEDYYRMNNIDDLQNLMNVLYSLRHPLLNVYLKKFNITTEPHIHAIAKIYSKDKNQMRTILEEIHDMDKREIAQDILLVGYIFKEESLINKIQSLMNFGSKEMKVIKQLIKGEALTGSISSTLQQVLFSLCKQLIIIEEFDLFQDLTEKLINNDTKNHLGVCRLLSEFKFDELAIDMLIVTFKSSPNNLEVIRLLGDLCFRNDYLEDTELFYTKLLNLDSSYEIYERNFRLYEKKNDTQGMDKIGNEIVEKFPAVSWVHELYPVRNRLIK